jgi:hypothetical protein
MTSYNRVSGEPTSAVVLGTMTPQGLYTGHGHVRRHHPIDRPRRGRAETDRHNSGEIPRALAMA